MTRKEQLEFCKLCEHQQFNPNKGIICSLTGNIATFQKECEHFTKEAKIIALEQFKASASKANKPLKPAKPPSKPRSKEKINNNEWFLLAATALITTFCIRLKAVADFSFGYNNTNFFFILAITCSLLFILIRRSFSESDYEIFGHTKFILIYSGCLSFTSSVYVLIVHSTAHSHIGNAIYTFVLTLVLGQFCSLLLKPSHLLYKKLFRKT